MLRQEKGMSIVRPLLGKLPLTNQITYNVSLPRLEFARPIIKLLPNRRSLAIVVRGSLVDHVNAGIVAALTL